MDEWIEFGAVVAAGVAFNRLMGWPGPFSQSELLACETKLRFIAEERESMLQHITALEKVLEEKNDQIAEERREFDKATGAYEKHIFSLQAENEKLIQGYANSARREINRNRAVARLQDITERMNEDAAAGPDDGTIE